MWAGVERRAVRSLAGLLPPDVRVQAARRVPPEFDARFSALWRRYSYRVCDDPSQADPLRRRDTVTYRSPVDVAAMNAAVAALLGEHDFAAYCRRRVGVTTVRTLLRMEWLREHQALAVATVVATAFCHNMVRAMVGALLSVGDGRKPVTWPGEVLARGIRDPAVNVAPPHGLCLEEVGYPAARAASPESAECSHVDRLLCDLGEHAAE